MATRVSPERGNPLDMHDAGKAALLLGVFYFRGALYYFGKSICFFHAEKLWKVTKKQKGSEREGVK